jgi:hypothetical protein
MSDNTTRRRAAALLATGVLVIVAGCGSDDDGNGEGEGDSSGPTVLAADAEVDGMDSVALLDYYTDAWVSEPLETSFIGELSNCDMGSSTDSVYFAPTFVEPGSATTQCTMQASQTLFLSPVGLVCIDDGEEQADTACLDEGWDLTSSAITINGDEVDGLDEREFDTEVLTVALTEGNIFDLPPGDYDVISRAQVVLVSDLPVGSHTIAQSGNFADGEFEGTLTMELTVEP